MSIPIDNFAGSRDIVITMDKKTDVIIEIPQPEESSDNFYQDSTPVNSTIGDFTNASGKDNSESTKTLEPCNFSQLSPL